MLRILFWNVNGKDLTSFISEIVRAEDVSIVVLCEADANNTALLNALQGIDSGFCRPRLEPQVSKFRCFTRGSELDFSEVHSTKRFSVRRLQIGIHESLVGIVHGKDQRNNDQYARQSFAQEIADEMRMTIERLENKKALLLGDFNLNPFDPVMSLALGFNAMMTRNCIARGMRKVDGKEYDFYFNPMWGFLGDGSDGPPGTVYDTSNMGLFGWNMPDQVLVHHAMLPHFEKVRILDRAGARMLVKKSGRPANKMASDHLPLLIDLKET